MKMKAMVALFAVIFLLGACSQSEGNNEAGGDVEAQPVASEQPKSKSLLVTMQNAKGKNIGQARLTQMAQGVLISLEASDLKPGEHGFHIHETGKCTPPDFESAGGHFNPLNKKHGFDSPQGPHAGDLPNIIVGKHGTVQTIQFTERVTLEKGKKHSLLDEDGSALVIHSKADDYKSQPSGAAGERIACGEINN